MRIINARYFVLRKSMLFMCICLFTVLSVLLFMYFIGLKNELRHVVLSKEIIDQEISFIEDRLPDIEKDTFGRCLKRSPVINVTYDWKLKPSPCSADVNIVLLIKSSGYRSPLRWTLRGTWAQNISTDGYRVKRIFLVGSIPQGQANSLLKLESSKYDDILQGYFGDTYKSMSKKIILGMRFVKLYCSSVEMIWVVDDDSVILPWNLASYLKGLKSVQDTEYLFAGFLISEGHVYRYNTSVPSSGARWRLTFEEYSCHHFADYLSGMIYILSAKTLKQFYLYTRAFDPLFLDDVFLGIIAGLSKVKLHRMPKIRFHFGCDTVFSSHSTDFPEPDYIACHGADLPASQLEMWHQYCALPVEDTPSFVETLHMAYCFDSF